MCARPQNCLFTKPHTLLPREQDLTVQNQTRREEKHCVANISVKFEVRIICTRSLHSNAAITLLVRINITPWVSPSRRVLSCGNYHGALGTTINFSRVTLFCKFKPGHNYLTLTPTQPRFSETNEDELTLTQQSNREERASSLAHRVLTLNTSWQLFKYVSIFTQSLGTVEYRNVLDDYETVLFG